MKNLIILVFVLLVSNLGFCYEELSLGFYPMKTYCFKFLRNVEKVSNVIELSNEIKYINREWKVQDANSTNIYYFWCEKDGTVKIWKNNVMYYIICLDVPKMRR